MSKLFGAVLEFLFEILFRFLAYFLMSVLFYFLLVKKENQAGNLAAGIVSALIACVSGWFATLQIVGGSPGDSLWVWLGLFFGFAFNTYRMLSHYFLTDMPGGPKD